MLNPTGPGASCGPTLATGPGSATGQRLLAPGELGYTGRAISRLRQGERWQRGESVTVQAQSAGGPGGGPPGETSQPIGTSVSGPSGRDRDLWGGKQQIKAKQQIESSGPQAMEKTIQLQRLRMSLTFFIREGEAGESKRPTRPRPKFSLLEQPYDLDFGSPPTPPGYPRCQRKPAPMRRFLGHHEFTLGDRSSFKWEKHFTDRLSFLLWAQEIDVRSPGRFSRQSGEII